MKRGLFTGLLLVFMSMAVSAEANVSGSGCLVSLMPCPKQVTVGDGKFAFNHKINLYFQGMSAERRLSLLARSRQQLKRLRHLRFENFNLVQRKENADIVIVVSNASKGIDSLPVSYQLPMLGDDESYRLTIDTKRVTVLAETDFGVLHAFSSLVQLLNEAEANSGSTGVKALENPAQTLLLPALTIIDKPRFKWRGLLIDSVRHFIPIDDIKRQLDGMAAAKLNVFHWHLTDDQGWRIESKRHPMLHQLASDNLYYTHEQIVDVVNYASLLGIRVLPEFDIPGHASAIAVAYPNLMAEQKEYVMERHWGVFEPLLDVSNPDVYTFIDELIVELTTLFPDEYIHIGGDEVNPKQWLNNQNIQQVMLNENLKNSYDLHHYFNLKVQTILSKHHRKMMGWDEIYHPDLSTDIVIQSWRGLESLTAFTNDGYQGVLSTGFYIDQPQYSSYHYRNEPINTNPQAKAVSIDQSDNYRYWKLTIPRLKGTDVIGAFVLLTKQNKQGVAETRGYLKLNDQSFKPVSFHASASAASGANQAVLHQRDDGLIFNVDSWMGPLRFEIQVHNSDRLFIGNAYYPLIADELHGSSPPSINLASLIDPLKINNVLGGEATLWSEMVTPDNIDLRAWPRLFVIAERLWSPTKTNNIGNMYQRLRAMDNYSSQVIGLAQKQQQRQGFSTLLAEQNNKTNINALIQLAALIEPAHYYTRHHIKFQQDQYHQLAPLDGFVDYLSVESFAVIELNNLVNAFKMGDKTALTAINREVTKWQNSLKVVGEIIRKSPKLANLEEAVNDLEVTIKSVSTISEICSREQSLPAKKYTNVIESLRQIQAQQKEWVLAVIPAVLDLLSSCRARAQ